MDKQIPCSCLFLESQIHAVQNQKEASHFNYILTYIYRANAIIQCDAKLQLQVSDIYFIPTNVTIDESERKSSKEWLKSSTLSLELTCNT